LFQHDVNVIWDLAVHDLSIMDYVLPDRPCAIAATAMSHVAGRLENIAYLTVFFPTKVLGHIHVNWLAPVKIRQTTICGSRQMIVYDDSEPDQKVKVYDRGVVAAVADGPEHLHKLRVQYRVGDMLAPRLDATEALRTEASHFIACIERATRPITDGAAGLRVVDMLEAASQSLVKGGRAVPLGSDRAGRVAS
jgi:predicted dehydrogenase